MTLQSTKQLKPRKARHKDYLQVLAYMFRFGAKKGYYFYPEAEDRKDQELLLNKGSTYEKVEARGDVCLIKHGLRIPEAVESYEAFVVRIHANEIEFRKVIADSIA